MPHSTSQPAPSTAAPAATTTCPACGGTDLREFYRVADVPVNSVRRIASRDTALAFPVGTVDLALCPTCGFIFNRAFDPARVRYDQAYDGTQSFSSTFNAFHKRLADDLIARYDLQGKEVVEIGCGQGEFLHLLAERGDIRGLGFDPACVTPPTDPRIEIVDDVYSAAASPPAPDLLCCKMTLEHIPDVAAFMRTIRDTLADDAGPILFFQVPDAERILDEGAFWDIYYEHCSYFTAPALAGLFRRTGFAVQRTWTDYDDQYLMIEARPRPAVDDASAPTTDAEANRSLNTQVESFARTVPTQQADWRRWMRAQADADRRVVLWGGGSKAVSFLTSLGLGAEVAYVVDINPHKQGTYLAGTGHPVVGPDALAQRPPDTVVVMNPVYTDEIRSALRDQGLQPHLLTIEGPLSSSPPRP